MNLGILDPGPLPLKAARARTATATSSPNDFTAKTWPDHAYFTGTTTANTGGTDG